MVKSMCCKKVIKDIKMYYITLDLEWNQAYAQKALAVQRQLSARLRGEVIQIGAVKLDSKLRICGSYQIIVKPKYFKKLHSHVSSLTGITQAQMDVGTPLTEAAESFRRWCGEDFAFLTWGPDDIPMLKENFHVNSIDQSWLNNTYDLQLMFSRQTDGLSKQRALEYAMDYYGIPMNLPAHDALNDAYFTALVAQKLDITLGIRTYNERGGEFLEEGVIGDADAGDDGYVTIGEMLSDDAVANPLCPICKGKLISDGKVLHSKGQRYTLHYRCEKCGDMLLSLKLHKNFNETWRARRTVSKATEEQLAEFKDALVRTAARRKIRQRKPRGPRRQTEK